MFVVHFMRPANGFDVGITRPGKPPESLVYDDVVHHKIGKTVSHYAKTDCLQPINMIDCTYKDAEKAWCGKNDKEIIVLFEEVAIVSLVVIMV